jgi:hypothetical protein
VRRASDTG